MRVAARAIQFTYTQNTYSALNWHSNAHIWQIVCVMGWWVLFRVNCQPTKQQMELHSIDEWNGERWCKDHTHDWCEQMHYIKWEHCILFYTFMIIIAFRKSHHIVVFSGFQGNVGIHINFSVSYTSSFEFYLAFPSLVFFFPLSLALLCYCAS